MIDPRDETLPSGSAQSAEDSDEAYCSACNKSFPADRDTCPDDGARLVKLKAARDALLGRVFDGRYEVRAALGSGGMGTVYRALQLSVDREVAVKVVHPKLASDRVAVKRFLREARLASRLSQPNIVNVYDFGQSEDGILYLVMELLRGHTLADELDSGSPMSPRRTVGIALQLCDALEAAHGQGIVHRDLKPGNIVVLDDPPGRDLIKVLDFGLAKSLLAESSTLVTNSSAILGTPLYIPPEQIEGRPSDQRADLYSLGCILHHALAGTPPFLRDNANMVLAAHIHDAPPPLPAQVPAALATLVGRLMAKDPEQRPPSAAHVRAVLQAAIETASAPAALATTDPALSRPAAPAVAPAARMRRTWLYAMAAVALAAIVWVAALSLRSHTDDGGVTPTAPRVHDAALPQLAPADAGAAQVQRAPVDAAVPAQVPPDAAIAPIRPAVVPHTPRPRSDAGVAPTPVPAPPPSPVDAGLPPIDFVHGSK